MNETIKTRSPLRKKAEKIKEFRCKHLIAVIENPDNIKNIGTVIRNVNALGVEKAYVINQNDSLPDDWQEMRTRPQLKKVSASAIQWSFVKTYQRYSLLFKASGEKWIRVCGHISS